MQIIRFQFYIKDMKTNLCHEIEKISHKLIENFSKDISDKGLSFKIYEELLKFDNKKMRNPI